LLGPLPAEDEGLLLDVKSCSPLLCLFAAFLAAFSAASAANCLAFADTAKRAVDDLGMLTL
jgi:hypothetical protein